MATSWMDQTTLMVFPRFYGATRDFCTAGCQPNFGSCGAPSRPVCSGAKNVGKRTIGYYQSLANSDTRKCQKVSPEDLKLDGFTHVNFAFAFFNPTNWKITPMDTNAAPLYGRFTGLKRKYPALQTWVSVGGWSFTDAADDRGGVEADVANYVLLVQEMKSSLGSKYGLSITPPTSYWYLRHFDLKGIQDSVDWFNLMAYDLHGTWNAQSVFDGPYIAPHTNITEIDAGLDLLWRAGVAPYKVVMEEAWYGRSFTLKDPSCNTPNGVCQFSGGANEGRCSNAVGILDYQEIQDIIVSDNVKPVHDQKAAVKWITWGGNQCVSYDDDETLQQKRDFANSRCLGGLMVWAMDQKGQNISNGLEPFSVSKPILDNAQQMSLNQQASITCCTSGCGEKCKKGTNQVDQMNGQPSQISTSNRCSKGKYRSLCCDDGTIMGKCTWRGFRGVGLSCIGGCAEGETEIARNTNHHSKHGDQTCNGGLQSYCCVGFKPAQSADILKQDVNDAVKGAAQGAIENAALDVAAQAFCRVAVPAFLAPLAALELLWPVVGEIIDIVELASTPAIIRACVQGIEKEGKAEFKAFGKKKTFSFGSPTQKPHQTRPQMKSHEPPKTSQTSSCGRGNKRAALVPCLRKMTQYETTTSDVLLRTTRTCSGNLYTQACFHYRSVISRYPEYGRLTCPYSKDLRAPRPAVKLYNNQHMGGWISGWMQQPGLNCERDEFPPADLWQDRGGQQWIRLIPEKDNGGAGPALFGGNLCFSTPRSHLVGERSIRQWQQGNKATELWSRTVAITRSVLVLVFTSMQPWADDGLTENPCWPSTLVNDPGFALLWFDEWNEDRDRPLAQLLAYSRPPSQQITQGKLNKPGYIRKRDTSSNYLDPSEIVFDDGNSTRRATDEELLADFGFLRCQDKDCRSDPEALGIRSAIVVATSRNKPTSVTASTTSIPQRPLTQDTRSAGPVSTANTAKVTFAS
ncbi:MAG: hypothetical protein Q9212_001643 [Teloschistes hypoglaucus]